ncbi:hypothetical protein ACF053_15535 [Streptomyces kanasensis]|uniref:DUF7660 family protein n=1 Tax=Streptomyces kanasensis TaxID=936756 RepID=UPI0037011170
MTNPLAAADRVDDREAFIAFPARLRTDHAEHGDAWENGTLDAFLDGLEVRVSDAPGWYGSHGHDLPARGA